jgi:bromodomain adjacent to zinc finger domain protein 1A
LFIFFSFDRDYLNRIAFYKKSQWQCAVTGRQGLTYEEAIENEKKHREQLKKFPRGLKQHILQMVQFSKYINKIEVVSLYKNTYLNINFS